MDGVYEAMRETFDVPEDDRFMTITEHDGVTFSFGEAILGSTGPMIFSSFR
jgi:hypothetical protein